MGSPPRPFLSAGSGTVGLPYLQSGSVDRPRLRASLESVVDRERVSVVAAPSGFGKTTAVAGWARGRRDVAWVTLTDLDTDVARVSRAVVRALGAVLGAADGEPVTPEVDSGDTGLLVDEISRRLEEVGRRCVLVVDDAHRSPRALSEGLLGALLEAGPETLRIVVVGSVAVERALSRHVLTNPAALIRAEQLRFDLGEVRAVADSSLRPVGAEDLLALTGGWPIAVRFASFTGSMVGRVDGDDVDLMVRYVQDQLLARLPRHLSRFVLDTSICGEFTPALAAVVSGRADAAELLDECAHAGLFLDRYDTDRGSVYRWHPFFARCAGRILELEGPAAAVSLHRLAAAALEPTDSVTALSHWQRAGDWEAVTRVIRGTWVSMLASSGAAVLDAMCVSLPAAWSESAGVLLVRACAKNLLGDVEVGRALMARADAIADPNDRALCMQLAIANLIVADDRDAVAAACAQVWDGLKDSGGPSGREYAAVLHFLGWAELRQRNSPARAVQALDAAARMATLHGDTELAHRARVHLAFVLAWAGQPRRAQDLLRSVGASPGEGGSWRTFVGGSGAAAAGYAAYWENDLRTAERECARALRAGGGRVSAAGVARMMLALTAAAGGDEQSLRQVESELAEVPRASARGIAWPAFRDVALAALAEARGRRAQAMAIAAKYEHVTDLPMVTVVLAGIVRRSGDVGRALRMLRRVDRFADMSYVGMTTLLTAAILADRAGRGAEAGDLCEQALEIASRTGVRRPLCEDEPALRGLLSAQLTRGTRFGDIVTRCLAEQSSTGAAASLSPRERVVLEQLRTVRTVPEIARSLGVSVNTVRTQQRSIYRKLGVGSRTDAVALLTPMTHSPAGTDAPSV